MITLIRSNERYTADHGWLKSNFSFSFAEYHDPANMHFGNLRVLNDDTVQPGAGFGMHPHRDMEIVTYVIEGALEHKDSMGHTGVIHSGDVQRITAGTGIYHSEYNASDTDPVHFLQVWILPREKGLQPGYAQRSFGSVRNALIPLVSGTNLEDTLQINQDAVFYAAKMDPDQTIRHQTGNRYIHLFMIEGNVVLNGDYKLETGDAARITDTEELQLHASSDAHFLLIDMAP